MGNTALSAESRVLRGLLNVLVHHPLRDWPVADPWLFDTEVLAPILQVLETRDAEELGDGNLEGVGELFESLPWSNLANTCHSMLAAFI